MNVCPLDAVTCADVFVCVNPGPLDVFGFLIVSCIAMILGSKTLVGPTVNLEDSDVTSFSVY